MVSKGNDQENPTAVEPVDGFSESQLGEMESFADVLAATGGEVVSIGDVLGNGFSVLEDKSRLIGTEMMVVRYGEHESDKGSKGTFATLHIITRAGEKYIVNDGSTGIQDQCAEIKEKFGKVAPLYVAKGLRVSEYDYTDPNTGKTSKARTYYLNTAK